MSNFGGLIFTNKGRNLQAKAEAGAALVFTKIKIGSGELGGQSISTLSDLITPVKTLSITKCKTLSGGQAVIGTSFNNTDLATGFYWRELGLFATDPDLGEILYCYGNSGSNAEYIPPGGGPDIVEKSVDITAIIGNATSVSAVIDQSLVFVKQIDFDAHVGDADIHVSEANRLAIEGIVNKENLIKDAAAKVTPVDADTIPISDSAASFVTKKVSWANIKATLKTYFDTLYNKTTIANNLTTTVAGSALDATQGKALSDQISTLTTTVNGKAVKYSATGSLTVAGWSGSVAPYSQAITITGILPTDTPDYDIVLSGTYATDVALETDWANVYRMVTSADTCTFYAHSKPTVALPFQIKGVR